MSNTAALTAEELLKPRYEVIADYPYCPYKIGELLKVSQYNNSECTWLLTKISYRDEFGVDAINSVYWEQSRVDELPHLFRKLQWWEKREVGEMPEYVKCIKTPDQRIMPNMVFKCTHWFADYCSKTDSELGIVVMNNNCFLPATETEYNQYISKK